MDSSDNLTADPFVPMMMMMMMMMMAGCVSGVAYCENRLYLVYRLLNTIHVFSPDLYNEVKVIAVKGMRFPLDIVACRDRRQLYVADSGNCHEQLNRSGSLDIKSRYPSP